MEDAFFKTDQRIIPSNGWRDTTYTRTDGSRFKVALPPHDLIVNGQPTGEKVFNEYHEMKAALRLYSRGRK